MCAGLAASVLAASGCGGDSESSAARDGKRTKLTVGLVPTHEAAPIYLGVDQGIFVREGFDIEIRPAQGGAAVIPQVISGGVQVGFSNTPSLLSAAGRGLPIEIVAPGGGSQPAKRGRGENLDGAVMVRRDSRIRTYPDLTGKRVAVNTLRNISDLTLNAALEQRGIDHRTVKYLEVPFPDMLAALDAARVDAAFLAIPFKTMAERTGHYRTIGLPLVDVRPQLVFTSYFVSRQWAEKSPDALGRFLRALRRAMVYAAEHEREARATIAKYAKLPKDLIPAIPLGNRRPDCRELVTSSELLARLMVRFGALEREPDLGELIRPGFCDG